MNYASGSWRALKATLVNLFRPVATESERHHSSHSERYKGTFALLHEEDPGSPAHGEELCIACLGCEKICPSDVITIESTGRIESPKTGKKRGYASDFTLDLQACIYCELCIQVCPTDAIVFVRELQTPSYNRDGLVLTMEKLYENAKKERYWAVGSTLVGMQNPKIGEKEAK